MMRTHKCKIMKIINENSVWLFVCRCIQSLCMTERNRILFFFFRFHCINLLRVCHVPVCPFGAISPEKWMGKQFCGIWRSEIVKEKKMCCWLRLFLLLLFLYFFIVEFRVFWLTLTKHVNYISSLLRSHLRCYTRFSLVGRLYIRTHMHAQAHLPSANNTYAVHATHAHSIERSGSIHRAHWAWAWWIRTKNPCMYGVPCTVYRVLYSLVSHKFASFMGDGRRCVCNSPFANDITVFAVSHNTVRFCVRFFLVFCWRFAEWSGA